MKRKSIITLLNFVVWTELVGAAAGFLNKNALTFYRSLVLPDLTPPDWAFHIVWFVIYGLMGVSAYIIFSSNEYTQTDYAPKRNNALSVYVVQLTLTFLWNVVFFSFQQLLISVVMIIVLLILVITMILMFYKINRKAAYLNIPYLVWLLFYYISKYRRVFTQQLKSSTYLMLQV